MAFTPLATDLLMVAIDFSADTVSDLKGTRGNISGIESGYADGDLVITANMWNGSANSSEFGAAGWWFVRN